MNKLIKILQDNLFLKNGSCPICGRVLFHSADYCCEPCLRELPLNSGPTCRLCGRGLNDDKKACSHCLKENYPFSGGYAHFHYFLGAKKIIAAIKFNNRPNLATWVMENIDYSKIPWISQIDFIEAIPIHQKRRAKRGYNQSDYIAIGVYNQLKTLKTSVKITHHLIRSHNNPYQRGQSQKKRLENINGVFDLVNPRELTGKKILLVDDVLTTGATLGEAANTLIEGGAAAVYTLVIAALSEI